MWQTQALIWRMHLRRRRNNPINTGAVQTATGIQSFGTDGPQFHHNTIIAGGAGTQ